MGLYLAVFAGPIDVVIPGGVALIVIYRGGFIRNHQRLRAVVIGCAANFQPHASGMVEGEHVAEQGGIGCDGGGRERDVNIAQPLTACQLDGKRHGGCTIDDIVRAVAA